MWQRKDSPKNGHSSTVQLTNRPRHWLEQLHIKAQDEPWGITMVSFAWTAGPVTYLAALAGYYAGYGAWMPIDKGIYFVGYSVVAGILGILSKYLYHLTTGSKLKQQQKTIRQAIASLPPLVWKVRDLSLASLTEEARKYQAASYLLQQANLGAEGIEVAVYELTEDHELALQAKRIEVLRQAGLPSRMIDLIHQIEAQANEANEKLRANYPQLADQLSERLRGIAPSPQHGRQRSPLFIERILSAIEQDNYELMTLADTEELFTLTLELLCDREISYLKIEYQGTQDIAKAITRLEEERNDYRISRAKVLSRLKALTSYLSLCDVNEDIHADEGLTAQALLSSAINGIEQLAKEVNDNRQLTDRHIKYTLNLQERTQQFESALELYEQARKAYLKLGRDLVHFRRALQRWQHITQKKQQMLTNAGGLKRNIIFTEQSIKLDTDEKAALAKTLNLLLKETNHVLNQTPKHNAGASQLPLLKAKELAVELTIMLDRFTKLHSPKIQRAIYSSHAMLIDALEPDASVQERATEAKALAEDVESNLSAAAERLAQNLIRFYRVPLTNEVIDFMVHQYDANRERLNFIAENEVPYSANFNNLNTPAIQIPEAKNNWKIILYNAKRTLSLYM
ncbi:hypothetical protein [Spartinivicinus ruber]|uniref:hypothetical protein n=1 Tax=Spartinivicinus ruber TaxID=2683272 RepID=UPI0013D232DC|nr:hypothetical protein [Spartinivicinus ruber]